MKETTLQKGSLFKFACKYGGFYGYETETDFCTYTRSVLKGVIAVLAIIAAVFVFTISPVMTMTYIVNGLVEGFHDPDKATGAFITVTCIYFALAALAGVLYSIHLYSTYRRRRRELLQDRGEWKQPEPGFIKLWWNSFHNKTCFRINFTEE